MLKLILGVLFFVHYLVADTINVQLKWKYQFQFAGFIMAKEKGFYKEEGLNVNLKELSQNTDVIKEVLNHPATYGVGDSGLIRSILLGKEIELLMPIYEHSPFVLCAINLKNINSLKDIENYHVVLDQFAIQNPAILAMLKSKDLDINNLNIQKENFYNDIHQKGVFAFYKSNELFTLNKNKIPYKIFEPKRYGFDFYGDILFTSKNEAQYHQKRVKKFIEATKKGFIYAFNHIEETINVIMKKYNTQHFSKEKYLFEAKTLKSYLSSTFRFDIDKLQNIKNIYILLGKIKINKSIQIDDYLFSSLNFTKEEKNFIKTHLIKAISTYSWEPFNLIQNGELEGIAIDYWKYIKKEVNLNTQCFIAKEWGEVLRSIKTKENDITCSTTITEDRKKYAIFSKPYVSFPIVIATRNSVGFIENIRELKNKKIAVGKNYTAEKLLKQHYPYLKLIEVKNTDEALKFVSDGKVFAAVDILPVIAYKISKYDYSNLKISGKTDFNFDVRFMVRKDYPELVSIINKVIDNMPQKEKDKIYSSWVPVNYQLGIMPKEINKISIIVGIIFLLIIGWLITLILEIRKIKKLETKLEVLATVDQLTSIFNRYKIDIDLNTQLEVSKRYNRPLSVVFFDIDHFKRVNDTYGHKVGDLVLINIAKLVSKNIRGSDIFGRWGGEEFLVILPETSLENAKILAEKLRNLIENYSFEIVGNVTCSFGVTMAQKDDTIDSLMKRVDDLLYKAKQNGRNQVIVG